MLNVHNINPDMGLNQCRALGPGYLIFFSGSSPKELIYREALYPYGC